MSDHGRVPVVEWATDKCSVFEPETGTVTDAPSLAEAAHLLAGRPALLALSRKVTFLRTVRLPDVSKEDMLRLLNLQLGTLFPVDAAELAVDIAPTDEVNAEGRLVIVVAVRTDQLRLALDGARQAGLRVVATVPSLLASMNAGMSDGCVLARKGLDLAIETLESGVIRQSRMVAWPGSEAAARVEAERSLAAAGLPHGSIKTVGGLELDNSDQISASDLELLTHGTWGMDIELPESRTRREQKAVQSTKGVALMMCVAAMGAAAIVFDVRSEQKALLDKGEKTWAKRLTSLKKDNQLFQSRATLLREQKDQFELAFEPKQPLGDVMTVLTNLAPGQLWLTGISLERGKRASLRGTAMSNQAVTSYLASLGEQSRMRDVKLVFANNATVGKVPIVNFSISAHVVGNMPLPDAKKGAKK